MVAGMYPNERARGRTAREFQRLDISGEEVPAVRDVKLPGERPTDMRAL
jgi:hypothetical protein